MATFEAGDNARLRAGGPRMTIRAIEGTQAICVWFEDKKNMTRSEGRGRPQACGCRT